MSLSYKENYLTQEWLQKMFHYRNSQAKDSYQYDKNSCMMIMSIPLTWHKRDLNANIHEDKMSIPSTYNKGLSRHNIRNHGNKYIK